MTGELLDFSITLVRHGESDWNQARLVQGQNDTAQLTEQGRAQAEDAGKSLQTLGFDLLFSSDLARARETAAIIGAACHLKATADPLLRERCFGVFEGRPVNLLSHEETGIVEHVLVNPDARPLDGESFRDVVVRAGEFLERARSLASSTRLLIVTHGGTIRALRAFASKEALEGMAWDRVDNCSVWTLHSRASGIGT